MLVLQMEVMVLVSNGRFVIQARYKLENKQKGLFFSDKTNDLHKGKSWEHGAVISAKGTTVNEAGEDEKGKVNMSKQEFKTAESPKNVVIANLGLVTKREKASSS